MTKKEMLNEINKIFDDMLIQEPVTKIEFLNYIEKTFNNLLIDESLIKSKKK